MSSDPRLWTEEYRHQVGVFGRLFTGGEGPEAEKLLRAYVASLPCVGPHGELLPDRDTVYRLGHHNAVATILNLVDQFRAVNQMQIEGKEIDPT